MARVRIQVVLDEADKVSFQAAATRAGRSLSGWMREAAAARLAKSQRQRLDTVKALRAFFRDCDEREGAGREPDWEEHLSVIGASQTSGAADS